MAFLFAERYLCTDELGSGVFGDVWRATDQHLGTEVAVKLLRAGTPLAVATDEAQTLIALQSPHILEVLNADVHQDIPYLVTRVAQMGSVEDVIGPYGIDTLSAARWARHTLVGLAVCHQRGLIHRDIKPANIFLHNADEALLGDFGVAARVDANGMVTSDGDHRVRPPEAYTNGLVNQTADIYAVGLTLYWMVTGACPFDADDVPEQVELVLGQDQPRVRDIAPHVPRTFASRIETAMSTEPTNRYQSAQEMHEELGKASLGGRVWSRLAPHAGHTRCWVGRRRDGTGGVSVCVQSEGSDHQVETRRTSGGQTRFRDLCASVRGDRQLSISLRRAFDYFN